MTDLPVPPVPDEPGPVIDLGYLSLPAGLQQAIETDAAGRRAAEIDAEPSGTPDPGTDPSRALSTAQDGSRERAGAVPALPLGAVFDPESHEGPPPGRAEKDAAAARTLITDALLGELGRRLGEYENAITWGTSCLSCSSVLDSSIRETERRERAEAKLAAVRDLIRGRSLIATEHIGAIISSEEGDSREH